MILKCKDLTVKPEIMEVRRGGKEINLTPSEYKLLMLFLNHRRQIFTINDIERAVFHHNTTNQVQVTICTLRQKIGKDKIKTLRGFCAYILK